MPLSMETAMNQIADVMTRNVKVLAPTDSIRRAAECMDELNVGVVPVCDGERVIGMITDRDIAVRAVAAGKSADSTPVSDVMSEHVRWCYDDQPVDEVMDEMCDAQIRRLPVIDHEHHLVGIVSLGDMAERGADQRRVGAALKDISSPSEPDRAHH
jgi:CBS domain-containing protein